MTEQTLPFTESQTQRIKSYLERGGKLTALSALTLFQTLRLSERIREAEADGLKVHRERIKVNNKHVVEYSAEV